MSQGESCRQTILFEEGSTSLSQSTAANVPSARAKMMPSFSGHNPVSRTERTPAIRSPFQLRNRSFMPAPESASEAHFAESSFSDRIGFASGQRKNRTAFLASGENAAKLRCCMSQGAFCGPVCICESRNCRDSRHSEQCRGISLYFRLYGGAGRIRSLSTVLPR
jgi:hypothetical protein